MWKTIQMRIRSENLKWLIRRNQLAVDSWTRAQIDSRKDDKLSTEELNIWLSKYMDYYNRIRELETKLMEL